MEQRAIAAIGVLTHRSMWYMLKLYYVSIQFTFFFHPTFISLTPIASFHSHQKGGISIYNKILKKLQQLDKEINSLQTLLASYPPGQLVCSRNGKYYKWYQSCEHSQKYIPKSNRQLAEKLAEKKYLSLRLEDMLNEQNALLSYLKERHVPSQDTFLQLTNADEYQNLFSHSFVPLSQELTYWMSAPYLKNTSHPEKLIYKSSSGNLLRSKSESIIDMLLHINKIPFRYECALQLNETTYFPDFTIRHPVTGKIYYWEHFGLMDNPDYCKRTFSKLENYTLHGIIPSIQLITTFETGENPLSVDTVQILISHYFL